MSKKRCYLCGGKLSEGRCVDCGLDNWRSERKSYRLNESYVEQSRHGIKLAEDTWDREDKNTKAQEANGERVREKEKQTVKRMSAIYKPTTAHTYQKANKNGDFIQPSKKTDLNRGITLNPKKRAKVIGVIIAIAVALIGPVSSFIFDKRDEIVKFDTSSEVISDSDPYQYVTRDLSTEGETYSIELEPGEYVVGFHLPEGNYQVSQVEGNGDVTVDDYENSIYLWQSIGMEEEYDELKEWIDVRLYQGAKVEVSGNLRVRMTTGSAQTDSMIVMQENPLSENILLEKGAVRIAGEDFPAGVYDLTSVGERSTITYKIPLYTDYEEDSLNYLDRTKWISADDINSVYHNVVLPEGTAVCSEDALAILSPSKLIESEDYDSYYDEYR